MAGVLENMLKDIADRAAQESRKRMRDLGRTVPGVVMRERQPPPPVVLPTEGSPARAVPSTPLSVPHQSPAKRVHESPDRSDPEVAEVPPPLVGKGSSRKRARDDGSSEGRGSLPKTPAPGASSPTAPPASDPLKSPPMAAGAGVSGGGPGPLETTIVAKLNALFCDLESRLKHDVRRAQAEMVGQQKALFDMFDLTRKARTDDAPGRRAVEEAQRALKAAEDKMAAMKKELEEALEEAAASRKMAGVQLVGFKKADVQQKAKIARLEGHVAHQAAALQSKDAELEELGRQVARLTEQGAGDLEIARQEAVALFMEHRVRPIIQDAFEKGADQGSTEGFASGYLRALAKVCSLHPELREELSQLTVDKAIEEMDAEMARDLYEHYERENRRPGSAANKATPTGGNGKGKEKIVEGSQAEGGITGEAGPCDGEACP